jgi:hypothetical protein
MSAAKQPVLMVSSVVYGYEELLDRIYASLSTFGYEVWLSHKGTMPVYPNMTALESCREAVQNCDLFLGIILPHYGTGKEDPKDDSIVHEELRIAIQENKPRWILAHDHVVFARSLIEKLQIKKRAAPKPEKLDRGALSLDKNTVFQDLRIIDMYELAIRRDVIVYRDRKGNWVQKFSSTEEANLFAVSQFRRYQEAEAFVNENFDNAKSVTKRLKSKGGRK